MHEAVQLYTKNKDPWSLDDPLISTAHLDNFETIYSESSAYLSLHEHDSLYYTRAQMQSAYWYSGNDGSGSGADADLLYTSTGNIHASALGTAVGSNAGIIILWYGSIETIPTGWQLADGTNGTRDLRDRMVIGAGDAYNVNDTGGSATFAATGAISIGSHTVTEAEMGSHRHPYVDSYCPYDPNHYYAAGSWLAGPPTERAAGTLYTGYAGGGQPHGHSSEEGTAFTGNAVDCMPPFYGLYYIQRI